MSRRIRIILGLLILIVSVSLLIWGFIPARRETRLEPIPREQLELPTPASFHFDLNTSFGDSCSQPVTFS